MTRWGERAFAIGWCALLLAGGIVGGTAGGSTFDGPSAAAGESIEESRSAVETNRAPMADAGLDQQVQVNTTVHLDATGSYDPDGSIVRYEWRIEHPDGSYSTPVCETCNRTQFIADERGVYEATVTVTDDDGAQRSDTLRVNVTGASGPAVRLRGPRRIRPDTEYEYTADVTAGDEDLARVLWFVDDRRVGESPIAGEGATGTLSRRFAADTTHTVRVEAVDWVGRRAVDRLRVTVESDTGPTSDGNTTNRTTDPPTNEPPRVSAHVDSPVEPGDRVVLDGDATDPDGDRLTYEWSQVDGLPLTLADADTDRARFRAPGVVTARSYEFRLTVSDGTATVTETVELTVDPDGGSSEEESGPPPTDNHAPSVSASADSPVEAGETVVLDGAATDPDGDRLTYEWSQVGGPAISITDARSEDASFVAPDVSTNATVEVQFEVDDGSTTSRDVVTVTVMPETSTNPSNGSGRENRPPTASLTVDSPVESGETVTLDGEGSDPDGDPLSYRWSQVGGSDFSIAGRTSPEASFVAPNVSARTAYEVRLTVDDGNATATANGTVVVEPPPSPDPALRVEASARSPVRPGERVTLNGTVTGAEGPVEYVWFRVSGPDVNLRGSNREDASFEAPDPGRVADVEFRLAVRDGNETGVAEATVEIVPRNLPPTVNATARSTVRPGESVALDGEATDPDGDSLAFAWSVVSGPAPGIRNAHSEDAGFVAPGVPSRTAVTFELAASDGQHERTATATVVVQPNRPPQVQAQADSPVEAGETVTLDGAASDPDGDPLAFEWSGPSGVGLQEGQSRDASFDAPNVTERTTYTFTLGVSDGSTTATDEVTVAVEPPNRRPTAEASAESPVESGETVSLDGTASDPDGDSLSYSWYQPFESDFDIRQDDSEDASFVAPEVRSEREFEVVFRVDDGSVTASDIAYVTVTPASDDDGNGTSLGSRILDREEGCLSGAADAGSGEHSCSDEVRPLENGMVELVDNNLDDEIRQDGLVIYEFGSGEGPIVEIERSEYERRHREAWNGSAENGDNSEDIK